MGDKDVVLQISRIKPDAVEAVESLYETIRDRKAETQVCLDETNVFAEAAFLHRTDHGDFLIIHIECDDWEFVQREYERSEHELDQLHREVLDAAVDETHWQNALLNPEFHVVVD